LLLSFVIPCYHSAETLPGVVAEIVRTVRADGRYDYEIILVNDNPPDDTWRVIEKLCRADGHIRGMTMTRNFGQAAALMAAYRASKGDIVVGLDDDGQNPPSETFKLVDALQDGVDVAFGDYPDVKYASLFRMLGSRLNDRMACWLLNKPKKLYLSSFVALRRCVVDEMIRYTGPYPYVDGLVLRATTGIVNVPVAHKQREVGSSGYSLRKLFLLWLNGFTAFSVAPLRALTFGGGLFTLAGLVFTVCIIVRKLLYGDAIDAGWSSLMCVLLIIGGMLLASLGLMGEYIGRIYISLNQAPQYVVRLRAGEENAPRE
jgi:glycosyltransferase involved in cell wall biosynthesis